jgi:putative restriction endonuclease
LGRKSPLILKRRNWNREELIITFNLYCRIPFSKINYKNPEIINLAHLIGRTPSAVALKLVNFARLDPALQKRNISGMKHGSKSEEKIWNEFYGNWEGQVYESELLLAGLKNEPLEKSARIDFDNLPKEGKERETLIKARVNQSFFRSVVLTSYENKCCITGLSIPDLLVASHIIPWSLDKKLRLSPDNGLCLNMLHDKAFDKGLITITPDYKVKLSPVLSKLKDRTAIEKFFIQFEGKTIQLPQRFIPDRTFLKYHNDNIFRSKT